MKAIEIKKGVYWVGAIDWNLRSFHGYTTSRGSTYNAYLIIDDHITLVDTVKAQFAGEMLERIKSVVDPAKIEYLVSNHVEMDHSGSIPAVLKAVPGIQVYSSAPQGVKGLEMHYGIKGIKGVKAGDSLNLGSRTFEFVPTPMVHWPDNMVTYCPQDKILFSNDSFGQHYASSGRFDDTENKDVIFDETRKYYANIVMPYGGQVQRALSALSGVQFDTICPSHGIVWRKYIPEILGLYKKWCHNETERTAVVVYDTMWHSTESMAAAITEAFAEAGVPAKMYDLKCTPMSDIMSEILTAKYIAVGSPTLDSNMLPTVSAFLTYLKSLAPKNRLAMAFGSYGWGGQSIEQVENELKACKFELLCERERIQYIPSDAQLEALAGKIREAVK